jgi:hypothetical protein
MNTKKSILIILTTIITPFLIKAQTKTAQPDSILFNASRLQWSGVELNEQQYKGMYHLSKEVLHLHTVVDKPGFSVFKFPNGSLFELYGPGSPVSPWKNGINGSAVGFAVDNIEAVIKELKNAGDEILGDVHSIGANYKYLFFRAPDGRVYAIVQTK